jgi:hypothetical protein
MPIHVGKVFCQTRTSCKQLPCLDTKRSRVNSSDTVCGVVLKGKDVVHIRYSYIITSVSHTSVGHTSVGHSSVP